MSKALGYCSEGLGLKPHYRQATAVGPLKKKDLNTLFCITADSEI